MAPRVLVYDHLDHPLFELDPSRLIGLKMVEKVNADHTLTITTTQELEKGQRIFISVEGKVREYVVTGDNASHTDGFTHEYYCVWSLMNDLSGDYIDDRRIGNKNDLRGVADILAVIVENNRWEVGTVSNSNLSSAWLYYTSAWDALGRAVEQWYGEVDTTITLGNPIVRRLDFLTKQGDQTPKRRFDYGYDLTSIKRTVLDDLYVCRIVPRGKGEQVSTDPDAYGRRITIEDVNPTGEEWIQDDDAALLTRLPDGNGGYDYPTQIVIFESIEDPQELYDTALAELETYTRPKVSYAADVLALSGAGMDVNGVELGDAVHVVDTTFDDSGLRLSARVMGIERDLLDPSNDKLTIGNFQPQLADVISKLSDGLSAAQEQLIDTDGKADAAMDDASASVQIANAAQSVANAVNQHFWDDSDGAHVTEVTKDEWNDALGAKYHTGANTLWNTLGMLFRSGLTNLLAIISGTDPSTPRGVAIYDGQGNASSNIVASFTDDGAVVGREESQHVSITPGITEFFNADGTVVGSIGSGATDILNFTRWVTVGYPASYDVDEVLSPAPGFAEGTLTITTNPRTPGLQPTYFYWSAEFTGWGTKTVSGITVTVSQEGSGWRLRVTGQEPGDSQGQIYAYYRARGSTPYYVFGTGKATGKFSFAEGDNSLASGDVAHAEGSNSTASARSAHAEGEYSIASGVDAHAEGYSTVASDIGAHSEGTSTTASGNASHAEGIGTAANGVGSHAQGGRTIANGDYQTVMGMYNIADTTSLLIIGNGNSNARSNALSLSSAGDLTLGTPLSSANIGNLPASKITSGTLPVARGGTNATTAADARDSLSVVAATNQSTQRATLGNFSGTDQIWGLSANCINTNNASINGKRMSLLVRNNGLSLYNSTDSTTEWSVNLGVTTLVNNSYETIKVFGRMVMVQVHGRTGTPGASGNFISTSLSSYKPGYNVSAMVSTSTGNAQFARLWVEASTGNIRLASAGYTSSAAWYGTLVYVY